MELGDHLIGHLPSAEDVGVYDSRGRPRKTLAIVRKSSLPYSRDASQPVIPPPLIFDIRLVRIFPDPRSNTHRGPFYVHLLPLALKFTRGTFYSHPSRRGGSLLLLPDDSTFTILRGGSLWNRLN